MGLPLFFFCFALCLDRLSSAMTEPRKTSLYDTHVAAGARMVAFGGWSMPVSYQSQIEEHHAVRRGAGMFDVSHMTIIDVSGAAADAYLRRLLANDVAKLEPREDAACRALYTCMLDEQGGILDDLIVYRLGDGAYRLVVNAATREKDLAWLNDHAAEPPFEQALELVERSDLGMVAVQGPQARAAAAGSLPGAAGVDTLAPFNAVPANDWLVARTGYTGEDGLEIMLPAGEAPALWGDLHERGVVPCGLGARDTLRLEAGLNLYGLDMDESVTPLECGLEWTIAFTDERAFIGRDALESRLQAGVALKQVGLILDARGVLRAGYRVDTKAGDGVVTSGTFSPTLGRSIALARVPSAAQGRCEVRIRERAYPARCVRPPFVRNGEIKIELEDDEESVR